MYGYSGNLCAGTISYQVFEDGTIEACKWGMQKPCVWGNGVSLRQLAELREAAGKHDITNWDLGSFDLPK